MSCVLVLGGSCFMGRQLVDHLQSLGLEVYTVNRGRTYWGDASRKPSLVADRRNRTEYRDALDKFIQRTSTPWLGVVDFCAFKPKDVTESLPDICFDPNIFPTFIFISTDSVYEGLSSSCMPNRGTATEALTDLGQLDPSFDKYGYQKLLTERSLFKRSPSGQNLLCLRLPDVIGEFDDTHRFWGCVLWIKSGMEMFLDSEADSLPLAFVYSADVVVVISNILKRRQCLRESINIGCTEQISLKSFLELIAAAVGTEIRLTGEKNRMLECCLYPSVERRRIPLSLEKSKALIEWKPTALAEVISRTVKWLEAAETMYPTEFMETVDSLPAPT